MNIWFDFKDFIVHRIINRKLNMWKGGQNIKVSCTEGISTISVDSLYLEWQCEVEGIGHINFVAEILKLGRTGVGEIIGKIKVGLEKGYNDDCNGGKREREINWGEVYVL